MSTMDRDHILHDRGANFGRVERAIGVFSQLLWSPGQALSSSKGHKITADRFVKHITTLEVSNYAALPLSDVYGASKMAAWRPLTCSLCT